MPTIQQRDDDLSPGECLLYLGVAVEADVSGDRSARFAASQHIQKSRLART